jgi:hypothetical protein
MGFTATFTAFLATVFADTFRVFFFATAFADVIRALFFATLRASLTALRLAGFLTDFRLTLAFAAFRVAFFAGRFLGVVFLEAAFLAADFLATVFLATVFLNDFLAFFFALAFTGFFSVMVLLLEFSICFSPAGHRLQATA